MKTTTVINTTILALCLSDPALAHKKKGGQGGSSSSSAGNNIDTRYSFKKSSFGAGSTINLGVQAQNNGGQSVAGNGGRSRRRDIDTEDLELYIRDIEDEINLIARGGIASGGDAKGGNTSSRGGNKNRSKQSIKNVNLGSGSTFSANTYNKVVGGNSRSGDGGINFGNGGAGGSIGFGFRKRGLGYYNQVPLPGGGSMTISQTSSINGGNGQVSHGVSNYQDGAPGMIMHFRRGGVASGGDARGGGSRSRGGNRNKSSQRIKNVSLGSGSTFAANNYNKVVGGNSQSGNGGANYGNGGGGGSASLQVPVGFKRSVDDLEYDEILAREIYDDLESELFARAILDLDDELSTREADPELSFEAEEEYLV